MCFFLFCHSVIRLSVLWMIFCRNPWLTSGDHQNDVSHLFIAWIFGHVPEQFSNLYIWAYTALIHNIIYILDPFLLEWRTLRGVVRCLPTIMVQWCQRWQAAPTACHLNGTRTKSWPWQTSHVPLDCWRFIKSSQKLSSAENWSQLECPGRQGFYGIESSAV